ncbi:MAG: hypothetical protein JWO42_261 [Chloroflexi bacterium]|nr:hypothetical protein [Chloroflexota bacterium]
MAWTLAFSLLDDVFAISRLAADAPVPSWALEGSFSSVTRTHNELSIVCLLSVVPDNVLAERGWRCLKVEGPFPLDSAVGVMAAFAAPLAEAGMSIFVIDTYDTDYLFVDQNRLTQAIDVLTRNGHQILTGPASEQTSVPEEKQPQR